MSKLQYLGTGRRKSSIARVILSPGDGKILVNKKELDEYFGYDTLIMQVKAPLVLTQSLSKYDVIVNVKGGGFTGQAGAIRPWHFKSASKVRAGTARGSKKSGISNARFEDERKKEVRAQSREARAAVLKEIIIIVEKSLGIKTLGISAYRFSLYLVFIVLKKVINRACTMMV